MLRTLGFATLVAIVIQGVLAGVRVLAVSTTLAMVHGMWGQVCFCLACVVALLTSRGWLESGPAVEARGATFFQRGTLVGAICVFLQLASGAAQRHFGVREALITHVLWAVVVILVLSWVAMWALEQYPHLALLAKLGRILAVLVGLQMILGGLAFLVTVMGGDWPATVRWAAPSAHVLVGAMLLACILLMTLSSRRLCGRLRTKRAPPFVPRRRRHERHHRTQRSTRPSDEPTEEGGSRRERRDRSGRRRVSPNTLECSGEE